MTTTNTLSLNESAEAKLTVAYSDTAKALSISPEDDFPEVFATARMIGLMELAAARVMQKLLQPQQLSVGVGVNVTHLAATPVGAEVKAIATFLGMAGKLYKFKVEAYDPGGKIGEGEHTRAIIDLARLNEGAAKRTGAK